MIREIIDTIKANKGRIAKRALIIGGAALGLAIVAKVVTSRNSDEDVELAEAGEVKDLETDEQEEVKENA